MEAPLLFASVYGSCKFKASQVRSVHLRQKETSQASREQLRQCECLWLTDLVRSPSVQSWIDENIELYTDLPIFKFDDLLEHSNKRYRSEYYENWLNRLYTQTPSNHPDRVPLLAAARYHRSSVLHAELIKGRDEIVQRVLASGNRDGPLLDTVFESPDYNADISQDDDADFAELCERFHSDRSRLELLTQDIKHYCGHLNDYCDRILLFPSNLETFMSLQRGSYPDIESKWTHFGDSFHRSLKVDLVLESQVRQPQGP